MTRQIPIDKLHELLKTAVAEGIIEEWTVEGHYVVIIHNSKPNPVPAFEAAGYLESLFRRRRSDRAETSEKEDR